jgi:hypothetical protein
MLVSTEDTSCAMKCEHRGHQTNDWPDWTNWADHSQRLLVRINGGSECGWVTNLRTTTGSTCWVAIPRTNSASDWVVQPI